MHSFLPSFIHYSDCCFHLYIHSFFCFIVPVFRWHSSTATHCGTITFGDTCGIAFIIRYLTLTSLFWRCCIYHCSGILILFDRVNDDIFWWCEVMTFYYFLSCLRWSIRWAHSVMGLGGHFRLSLTVYSVLWHCLLWCIDIRYICDYHCDGSLYICHSTIHGDHLLHWLPFVTLPFIVMHSDGHSLFPMELLITSLGVASFSTVGRWKCCTHISFDDLPLRCHFVDRLWVLGAAYIYAERRDNEH